VLSQRQTVVGISPTPGGSQPLYASQYSAGALNPQIVPATGKKAYLGQMVVTSASPIGQAFGVIFVSDGVWNLPFVFVETVSAGGCLNIIFKDALVATNPNVAITATMSSIGNGISVALDLFGWQV